MADYEYRVVPGPAKPGKAKGAKSPVERAAAATEAALNAEAASGWEFLRAETLPFEERQGLTGSRTVFRTLLVFRRPRQIDEAEATRAAIRLLENRAEEDAPPAAAPVQNAAAGPVLPVPEDRRR